jgi:DNA-binding MarR family transcriptional regulator
MSAARRNPPAETAADRGDGVRSGAAAGRAGDARKEAIDRIVETAIYLQAESRRLAREQCARHGITATQLNVLKLLVEIDDLSLSELSRRLAARNSTVTGIIDRMVTAGLVHREQSHEDRRVWRIRITGRGRAIARDIEVAPWDLLRAALRALPEAELGHLIQTLTVLATHVRSAVAASEGDSP